MRGSAPYPGGGNNSPRAPLFPPPGFAGSTERRGMDSVFPCMLSPSRYVLNDRADSISPEFGFLQTPLCTLRENPSYYQNPSTSFKK